MSIRAGEGLIEERPAERRSGRRPLTLVPSAAAWETLRAAAAIALLTGVIGLFVTVGADARWLAALGQIIVHRGSIPAGVPFATASTGHWVNGLVLAELIFHGLESAFGDRGLAVANLVAVAVCFSIVARDARAGGARAMGIVTALVVATIGALPSLAVARVQMFSLVLFPAMVALLRAEQRRPSARIWLALPLLALWSNLHGAALAGLAVLFGYLALSRFRQQRWTAVGVAVGALVAMSITPAGIATIDYYHGLVTNVAAQRGAGQWAPLFGSGFDWVLVGAVLLLLFRASRRLPALWELIVAAGLAVLTVKAARDGVWLLLFLVAPAAHRTRVVRDWNGLVPVAAACGLVALAAAVAHGPRHSGVSQMMVQRSIALAGRGSILADGLPSEQVALAGGRIWAGNPIDAFSRRVQNQYIDWMDGGPGGRAALGARPVRVVLVTRGSEAERLTRSDPAYRQVAADATATVYVRIR